MIKMTYQTPHFCLLLFVLFLVGCEDFNGSSGSDTVGISSLSCKNNFKADWCSNNLIGESSISDICSGHLYVGDIIYHAVWLKSENQGAEECLSSTGNSEEISVSGCDRAFHSKYSSITSRSNTTTILECADSLGSSAFMEGQSLKGNPFKVINIQ